MSRNRNKEYGESMDAGVAALVEHGTFDKATGHVTFDSSKLELPEGITLESINSHIGLINDLSSQVEVATAQIGRTEHANNNDLTTLDGTLAFGDLTIHSQHHLRQKVDTEFLFGQSTTAVDYVHSAENAEWTQTQRTASLEAAQKLFG